MMPWLKSCGPCRYWAVLHGLGRLGTEVKVGAVCIQAYLLCRGGLRAVGWLEMGLYD